MRQILLLALVLPALAADPAPPLRDPFAAGDRSRLPVLEGVAQAGGRTLAILRTGTRHLVVAVGQDVVCDGAEFALASAAGGMAVVRDRAGNAHRLHLQAAAPALSASAAAPPASPAASPPGCRP